MEVLLLNALFAKNRLHKRQKLLQKRMRRKTKKQPLARLLIAISFDL